MLLSRFLERSVQAVVVFASLATATTVVTVNGLASHAIPPLLCKSGTIPSFRLGDDTVQMARCSRCNYPVLIGCLSDAQVSPSQDINVSATFLATA